MRRICEEAGITLDGEHDYLTPHGGRRGAGDVLYREDSFSLKLPPDIVRLRPQKTATHTLKQGKRLVEQVTFLTQTEILDKTISDCSIEYMN